MAEGRMLKKRISKSAKFAHLKTDKARMLYLVILPHLDVEGRIEADPDIIKGQVIPRLKWAKKVVWDCLLDMFDVGLIILYKHDTEYYLQCTRFDHFQKLNKNREAKSHIPAFQPETGAITEKIYTEVWDEWEVDGRKCLLCGQVAEFVPQKGWVVCGYIRFQIDHIIPKSKGGNNMKDNLRIICQKCNGSKGNNGGSALFTEDSRETPDDSDTTKDKLREVKLSLSEEEDKLSLNEKPKKLSSTLDLEQQKKAMLLSEKLEKVFEYQTPNERTTFRNIVRHLLDCGMIERGVVWLKEVLQWGSDNDKDQLDMKKCFVSKVKKLAGFKAKQDN